MASKRIRAISTIGSDGHGRLRGRLPFEVREYLRAEIGDRLIFEEGTTWAAEDAAGMGPYIILRLEKKKKAVEESAPQPQPTPAEHDKHTRLEPFNPDTVQRILEQSKR